MSRYSFTKPKRLPEKLRQIRAALELSQKQLIRHLNHCDAFTQSYISSYESGRHEPSLQVLLAYARAAGVWVDVLIDDELDLPSVLPSLAKSEGIPHQYRRKCSR